MVQIYSQSAERHY